MQTEERRRKTCAASSLRPYLIFSISPDHECWASTDLRDFLVPACVKTVLRDYTIEDGLIVIDVQYDPMIGLVGGEGDEEF
jgi:hypothetical protein